MKIRRREKKDMKTYSITDIGRRRTMNQDYVYASEQPVGNLKNLLIVADGMGGHNAGDLASRYTVELMVEYITNEKDEKRPVSLLSSAIHHANELVMEKARSAKEYEGMGTTIVAATVTDGCLYVANVGDSRLYLIDQGIEQITRDHSLVEEMIRMGEIQRKDAKSHPDRNVITRAVGVHVPVRVDFFDVKLEKGDKLLLCSDGLTNMVEDEDILQLVKKSVSLKEAAERLVTEANKNGGRDNISVVLCGVPINGQRICSKSECLYRTVYEIISELGSGGMADVYKAKDHKLNRFVAVKVLKKEFRDDREFISKLRVRGAVGSRAGACEYPVNIYDTGEEAGIYYIVMELVEGITLKEYIKMKGRLLVGA